MNAKINSFYKRITFLSILLLASCTGFYEDYNTNQNEATEEMMLVDNLRSGAYFAQMQRNVVPFDERAGDNGNLSSTYQVSQGLTADIFAGYYTPTGEWYGGMHNGCYNFIDGWITQTYQIGFSRIMPAWQAIIWDAEKGQLPELAALATVVKVQGMHRVTDSYGPIPYVSFGVVKGRYDSVEEIYRKFLEELDEAIDVLTNYAADPSATILAEYDLVYAGNVRSWVKFANTLRLRLALRIVYVDPVLAEAEALKSAAHPFGFIAAPAERAALQHSLIDYWHPLIDIQDFNSGEARMSASMDSYLRGYTDPRISAYFLPVEVPHPNALTQLYRGARLGVVTGNIAPYVGQDVSKLNLNGNTEIVWMTAAESWFLRAEAALRGWNMGETAKVLYEKGITTSFEERGVSSSDYLTTNRSPVAYSIPAGQGMTGAASLPTGASSTVWSDTDSKTINLGRIITQKWIAMFPDGPEAWAEYRRTGFPRLHPVVTNNSNGTINTATQVRRVPYPQREYNLNAAGVNSGVSKLSGPDHGGTRLWWDVADKTVY